jgi:hypothetical protein
MDFVARPDVIVISLHRSKRFFERRVIVFLLQPRNFLG